MTVGHNQNFLGAVFQEVNLVGRESGSEVLYLKEFPNNYFRFLIIVTSAASTMWWIARVQRLPHLLLLTCAVSSYSWAEGPHVATDHVFGPLKRQMGGRRFSSNEEVVMVIRDCLLTLGFDFFCDGNFNSHELHQHALGLCWKIKIILRSELDKSNVLMTYKLIFMTQGTLKGEEEDVRNYWMTLRRGKDTLIWRKKL
jgi:hypothetical protein